MRRVAFALCLTWLAVAFGLRLHDRRPLNARIYARAAGQRRSEATVAWTEGPTRAAAHGHLVVAAAQVDGKLQRFSARVLPGDPADCKLWLEESSEAVQAVARCPGFEPLRLTADGRTLPAMGPYARAGTIYDLYPLTSFDPGPLMNQVHPHEAASEHPVLIALALAALLPLGWAGVRSWRSARRFTARGAILLGEVVRARPGVITVRDAARQIDVLAEDDQLWVRPLSTAPARSGWAAVHPGAPASVFGPTDASPEDFVRLARGGLLVVGELADELRRRLRRTASRDAVLLAAGLVLSCLFALGRV